MLHSLYSIYTFFAYFCDFYTFFGFSTKFYFFYSYAKSLTDSASTEVSNSPQPSPFNNFVRGSSTASLQISWQDLSTHPSPPILELILEMDKSFLETRTMNIFRSFIQIERIKHCSKVNSNWDCTPYSKGE
jgi:hypothetical protein